MSELGPNEKGNIAELAILFEATRLGIPVYRPVHEHGRCDCVLEIGGRLWRVQVKWARHDRDVVSIYLRTNRSTPRGYVTGVYDAGEVDFVAAYCADLNRSFLLPIALVAGKTCLHLRLAPARNGQVACTTLAADHDFAGAVAQLAERRRGTPKATGSNPVSSTPGSPVPDGAGVSLSANGAAPVHDVGAHEFRNHFGYWMERAAAGEEVRVSRHGTPFVRLVPTT